MKLTKNFNSDYKTESRASYNVSIDPVTDADQRDANILCEWKIECEVGNLGWMEATGVLVDVPSRGTVEAIPSGDEDDLDLILNTLFDGDTTALDRAIEKAYGDAIAEQAKPQKVHLPSFYKLAAKGEWDAVEVHPVTDDNKGVVETCEEGEEDYWSVYLHQVGVGVSCVADVATKEEAHALADLLCAAAISVNKKSLKAMERQRSEADRLTDEENIEARGKVDNRPHYVREGFDAEDYKIPAFVTEANGWEDNSWKNDACPCFINSKQNLQLWIGDTKKQGCAHLYCLQKTEEDGSVIPSFNKAGDETYDILATDSEQELLDFITDYLIR